LLRVFSRQSCSFAAPSLALLGEGERMKITFTGITQLEKWGLKKERVGERESCDVLQTISPA